MLKSGTQPDITHATDQPKRVVMLLANPFTHDTRVHKQARTLIEWGLEVHIVCIAKLDLANEAIVDGIYVHRVPVKDESVFRIAQGITKIGSPSLLRDWLNESFVEEAIALPEQPDSNLSMARTSLVLVLDLDLNEDDQSESDSEVDKIEAIEDVVSCPLPPIDPVPVPVVPELENGKMRMLAYPATLSQRSAERIQKIERALLSDQSGLTSHKPIRMIAHIYLRILRIAHRLLIHPVSTKSRLALSRETTKATRVHAALVRDHTIATVHSQREADRQTKLRDLKYVKDLRQARAQALIESENRSIADRLSKTALAVEDLAIQARIQKQALLQAKQDASARTLSYKQSLDESKRKIKRRAAWKKRSRIILSRIPSAVRIIGFNDEIARTALKLNPDLILAHDCNTLLAGRMLKEVTGSPLVYDSHELFLERNIGSRRRWVDKLCWWPIERGCIKSTDAIFTVAEGIARYLEAQYRIPEVYLLRNVQPYEPPPAPLNEGESSLMHQELGLDPSVRIVIYPGAITLNRGIEFMIDAAEMLDNAVFVVMGYANSEPYMKEILRRATANGSLNTSIFFKDAVPIDDVGRWVAGANLGVVPTQGVCMSYKFEASNKMFHCLMAGVPLAMSDHPEKRILADKRGVGVLFDETSPESIAASINATLNDSVGMRRMKANCLQAALELNWEQEVHRYLTVMSTLLPDHARTVPPVQIRTQHKERCKESDHEVLPTITVPSPSRSPLYT